MFSTKAALVEAIVGETVRAGDTVFAGQCGTFIKRAAARIFDGITPLRCREMETRVDLVVTSGSAVLPGNFLGARRLTWVSSRPTSLVYRRPEDFYERSGRYSRPAIFTIDGTELSILSPDTGSARLSYYARPALLESDPDTNAVLSTHGHVYLAASLIEAFGFLRDEAKTQEWVAKYMEAISGVNASAISARFAGTHLAPRTGV
jgi:hypothetical protein